VAQRKPIITIIGCGYVGLTLGAVLANADYTVHAIEINPKRLKAIKAGRSFFYEAGADPLIARAVSTGNLIPTDTFATAIPASDIVFSCVGTPDNADGSSNLSYVFDAANQALELMRPHTIYVQKSTVPVGTGAKIEGLFSASSKQIHYVSCPEFSREGTAILDTLWFDRVVTGAHNQASARKVLDLHRTIEKQRCAIAGYAGLPVPADPPRAQYMMVGRASAELIKVSANAFLALKISFANSIAKLADASDADIIEVMDGIGSDRRIGRAFLSAGRGYGGGCFPKDVSGLIRSAEDHGVDMDIMHAVTAINNSMPHYIMQLVKRILNGDAGSDNALKDKRVAVLGLSFKAGTSDVRRSPALVIANTLAEQAAIVQAYDPEAMDEATSTLDRSITLTKSVEAAVKNAEIIFIATDWPQFKAIDLKQLTTAPAKVLIVDCMNCLDPVMITRVGARYLGVGRHYAAPQDSYSKIRQPSAR